MAGSSSQVRDEARGEVILLVPRVRRLERRWTDPRPARQSRDQGDALDILQDVAGYRLLRFPNRRRQPGPLTAASGTVSRVRYTSSGMLNARAEYQPRPRTRILIINSKLYLFASLLAHIRKSKYRNVKY